MKVTAAIMMILLAGIARAHDARPLSITLVEQSQGLYRAVVRTPPSLSPSQMASIEWPRGCERHDGSAFGVPASAGYASSLLRCPGGLANRTIRIAWPLYNPSISTLIRLETLSGISLTSVLAPDQDHWSVPSEPGRLEIAVDYARLGFAHIWDGPDHLLFIAGLLLLAVFPRRIVWAVTGFTAAHSITLSLAALDVFRVPIAPTEALIALSIVFLAAEIARSDPESFSHRFPVVLSFAFGLLHGFGFASALGEIGLPRSELTTGLLFFNVGVELGQLAFIAAAVTVIAAVRTVVSRSARLQELRLDAYRPGIVGAYCLGIPAAFWFIDRAVSALAA